MSNFYFCFSDKTKKQYMENWKEIKGYEGLYEVSSLGRVKSLPRIWIACKNTARKHNGVILKCCNSNGYAGVALMKAGKRNQVNVHRLVADAFLIKDDERKEVNHKNGNRSDNRVDNLEWVTHSENIRHADRTGLRVMPKGVNHCHYGKEGMRGENHPMYGVRGAKSKSSKLVLDTQTGIFYDTLKEAAECFNIPFKRLSLYLTNSRPNKTSLVYA